MNLQTITIKDYLNQNRIEFVSRNGEILIFCPLCGKTDAADNQSVELHINLEDGVGNCWGCREKIGFPRLVTKLGFQDKIEAVAGGIIRFAIQRRKPKKENTEEQTPEEPPEIPIDTSKFKPLSVEQLIETLGLTIKKDEENKLITFLCELSAYTENSQLNISFNAPSSTGKSYIPTEIANLFPEEDVIELGYCSPTAFFHDNSKSYNKDKNELVVDLSRKILIFLDQPHTLLLQHLRPLLSHDKKEIIQKITDKTQRGGLKTKNIRLIGYPSVIFCTAGLKIDEQESTRFILLSPQTDSEKIREAIFQKIRKEADNECYKKFLDGQPERKLLKERIRAIKQERIADIKISHTERVEEAFFGKNRVLKPRHQRDIGRILSLIKSFALLNLWFREKDGSTLIANEDDILGAFKVWDAIAESQELNLPPFVYQIYKEVILPTWIDKNRLLNENDEKLGISRREMTKKHFEVYKRSLPDWLLRQQIIPMLENAGLIAQDTDPNGDKRKMLIYPTTQLNSSIEQNNSEQDGGVNSD